MITLIFIQNPPRNWHNTKKKKYIPTFEENTNPNTNVSFNKNNIESK
jgi:hypothetical protein